MSGHLVYTSRGAIDLAAERARRTAPPAETAAPGRCHGAEPPAKARYATVALRMLAASLVVALCALNTIALCQGGGVISAASTTAGTVVLTCWSLYIGWVIIGVSHVYLEDRSAARDAQSPPH